MSIANQKRRGPLNVGVSSGNFQIEAHALIIQQQSVAAAGRMSLAALSIPLLSLS